MSQDPFAGMGGSYIQHPDGTRELIERTGAAKAETAPTEEPIPTPTDEADKPKK